MIYGFSRDDRMFGLFNAARLREAEQTHELSANYSDKNYFLDNQVRFFIGYKQDTPALFSSIFRLDWWPTGAYRILNRLWKPNKDLFVAKNIDPLFFEMVKEQVNWLSTKDDFKVAFISRQGNSVSYLNYFSKQNRIYGNNVSLFSNPIRTCKGPDCDCLQNVVYIGDSTILERWPNDNKTT
jgi:hypothetical protein